MITSPDVLEALLRDGLSAALATAEVPDGRFIVAPKSQLEAPWPKFAVEWLGAEFDAHEIKLDPKAEPSPLHYAKQAVAVMVLDADRNACLQWAGKVASRALRALNERDALMQRHWRLQDMEQIDFEGDKAAFVANTLITFSVMENG